MSEHRRDLRDPRQLSLLTRTGFGQPLPVAWRRVLFLTLTWVAACALYLVCRMPLGELPARAIGVFFFAAVCWATELIPHYATAFLLVAGQILLLANDGGLASQVTAFVRALGLPDAPLIRHAATPGVVPTPPTIAAGEFLAPFARDIMFLFMGGFMLSAAITRHGLDRVIARLVLRPFQHSPLALMAATLGIAGFLSLWISNTATAAMLVAVLRPIVAAIPATNRYREGLMLAVPVGVAIGAIGTPISTAPNAIAFSALNALGYHVSFLGWVMMAVPLLLLLLLVSLGILWTFHRPNEPVTIPADAFGGSDAPARFSAMARVTLGVTLVAIAGWLTTDLTGIGPGVVALVAAAVLTATRALDRHDVDSINWSVLILIWGGLSLSVGFDRSGLGELLTRFDPSQWFGGPLLVASALALLVLTMGSVMSNTATGGLMIPIALGMASSQSAELAIVVALVCSFAMPMPVSTPPNAIAYATGLVSRSGLLRVGVSVGLACTAITVAGYHFVLPLVIDRSNVAATPASADPAPDQSTPDQSAPVQPSPVQAAPDASPA
jgi:sodium-dependent dicarboxylate transporter 2/3/5